jgi:hypothetical protein
MKIATLRLVYVNHVVLNLLLYFSHLSENLQKILHKRKNQEFVSGLLKERANKVREVTTGEGISSFLQPGVQAEGRVDQLQRG